MSTFRGYRCDKCGKVVDKADVTTRITRVDGPVVSGEYDEDLCRDCIVVPEGATMRPLRRRHPRGGAPEPDAQPIPAPEGVTA
jgi:hypothetical protein